jgi:hypothetical protein
MEIFLQGLDFLVESVDFFVKINKNTPNNKDFCCHVDNGSVVH